MKHDLPCNPGGSRSGAAIRRFHGVGAHLRAPVAVRYLPHLTGRYDIQPLGDGEWYWHAYLGDEHVNGGLCTDYTEGVHSAKRAVEAARGERLHREYYWDVETGEWVKKGDLPTVS